MNIRTLTLASIVAATFTSMPMAAQANTQIDVIIAPPAPMVEPIPAPREGHVWANGYWQWNGSRYVWEPGHWMAHQPGHHWVAHKWEHRGDRWYFHDGHWEKDS